MIDINANTYAENCVDTIKLIKKDNKLVFTDKCLWYKKQFKH